MARTPTVGQLDRRQRKSRAALRSGLLELVAVKPYDAITVEDVVAAADVSRATFYAHYRDKADLLKELSDEMISEAATRATSRPRPDPPVTPGTYSGSAAAEIIRHAGEHPHLYLLVLTGAGGPEPRAQLIATLRAAVATVFEGTATRRGRTPRVPMVITARAYTGSLLAVIEAWLSGDLHGTPEQIGATFMHAQVAGLEWALGLHQGELIFESPATST